MNIRRYFILLFIIFGFGCGVTKVVTKPVEWTAKGAYKTTKMAAKGTVKVGKGFVGAATYPFRDREIEGIASWYGEDFHGKKTASGETYNMYDLTAAHRTLALGSKIKVTNLDNGKAVVVRINDRGPFAKGRIIDLSFEAARRLDMISKGTAKVKLTVLD
ncbi:MAG: septal ring lytic transglycosylase RlpA family protein [Proteobacteria bacterium]|nr:septal ring lytic transglycosylase RlpA family protein [Pseudomonadota bacterium]NIS68359.1 septal ring lytic transglycosylase RlpA family protein [Pseudomonadota bacterium]